MFHICKDTILKAFDKKQDDMKKLLIEDRQRQKTAAEDGHLDRPVKKQPEQKDQPAAKMEEQKEAPKEKQSNKLFPKSALFKEWGENLSEADQREAQALFQNYGYNVFLSDRLPLDRTLPDTREPRYRFY